MGGSWSEATEGGLHLSYFFGMYPSVAFRDLSPRGERVYSSYGMEGLKLLEAVLWGPHPSPSATPSPAGKAFCNIAPAGYTQAGNLAVLSANPLPPLSRFPSPRGTAYFAPSVTHSGKSLWGRAPARHILRLCPKPSPIPLRKIEITKGLLKLSSPFTIVSITSQARF